jgi:heme a synthase
LIAGHLLPPWLLSPDRAITDLVQDAATAQWVHRLLGTLLLVAAVAVFAAVRRANVDVVSRRFSRWLMALIACQYVLGVTTLLQAVPIGLATVHQATAVAIVGVWIAWVHHVRNLDVEMAPGTIVQGRRPVYA